jgi:hypothetical protein
MRLILFTSLVATTGVAFSCAFVAPTQTASITRQIQRNKSTAFPNQHREAPNLTSLQMSTGDSSKSNLPMLLDPGTKGGALFLSLVLFVVPILVYQVIVNVFGVDGIEAGKWIGVGFTAFTTFLWVSTYIFRVATKDMTYVSNARQE